MYALPNSTLLNKQIPKKAIFQSILLLLELLVAHGVKNILNLLS